MKRAFTPPQISDMSHRDYSGTTPQLANQRFGMGFTLIELLVVAGIIVLFLGLSIPQLRSFQHVSHLDNAAEELVTTLRLAQSRTLGSEGDAQYGLYFDTTTTPHQYTLFEGSSYAARQPAKDETTTLQKTVDISSVALGGSNEVVFLRLSGEPSVQGTITFRQIADPAQTRVVSVLSSGTIEQGSPSVPSDIDRVKDSRHVHVSYQGRTIAASTESINLTFPDTTFSFLLADNMSAGQILWEGDVVSEGETQHLKIHTHLLNDPTLGTLFSLHRPRDQNTKSLEIEVSGDATGNLISYGATGTTTQGTSIYAGAPDIQ